MIVDTIPAIDLRIGMVIIPALRTMRHALIEKVDKLDTLEPEKLSRNHDGIYVIAHTDVGQKPYKTDTLVKVLIPSSA